MRFSVEAQANGEYWVKDAKERRVIWTTRIRAHAYAEAEAHNTIYGGRYDA